MRNRWRGFLLAGAAAIALSSGVRAQTPAGPGPAAAKPASDLSGVWTHAGPSADGSPVMGFLWSNGEPPMQPWAAAKYKALRQGTRNPGERGLEDFDAVMYPYCLPHGVPRVYTAPFPFEILQAPGRVTILYESNHQVRRIYTDGRKIPEGYPPSFMGFSSGKWEGDTLVVETTHLFALPDGLLWLDNVGHPHTDALRVVERFRRVNQDTLEIDFLFDDPKAYTKPWGGKKVFRLRPNWEIMEELICEDLPLKDFTDKVGGKK